jgi:hypothetical protein
LGTPRWTNVEDFLNDLPRYHCAVKPKHTFCTVCARINPNVAGDCPWRDMPEAAPKARSFSNYRSSAMPDAPLYAPPGYAETSGEDLAASADPDAMPQAVAAEGPIIEFAGSTEPAVAPPKPKIRMSVKVKRPAEARPAPAPAAPPPEPVVALEPPAPEPEPAAIPEPPPIEPVARPPELRPPAAVGPPPGGRSPPPPGWRPPPPGGRGPPPPGARPPPPPPGSRGPPPPGARGPASLHHAWKRVAQSHGGGPAHSVDVPLRRPTRPPPFASPPGHHGEPARRSHGPPGRARAAALTPVRQKPLLFRETGQSAARFQPRFGFGRA